MEDDMSEKNYEKKVGIRDIVSFFQLEQLTGDDSSLDRWTVIQDLNRPGFELAGVFKSTEPRRIVIIGNKESEFIRTMSEDNQRARFQFLMDGLTPCIIITSGNEIPHILREVAMNNNFPVLRTNLETYRLTADLITFLDEKLAPIDTMSGVLMSVYGLGVMILGESGMGKSETALDLIRDGQVLISDDRVDVQHIQNSIYGHAPAITKGLLEIRGIGVINVEKMFGASAVADRAEVKLVVRMVPFERDAEYNRIGDETPCYTKILGVSVPTIVIPVSAGRNTFILVESAVRNFRLQEAGYSGAAEINERFSRFVGKDE